MVLFCHITSRIPGEKYDGLLQEKGGAGFPHLVLMDAEGNVVGSPKGRTVEAFHEAVKAAREEIVRLAALRKRAAAGDVNAKAELLEADLRASRVDLETAKKQAAELKGVDAPTAAKLDAAVIEFEVRAVLATARTKEGITKAAETLRAMHKAGRTPKGEVAPNFWNILFMDAETRGDVADAEAALAELRKIAEKDPRIKLKSWEDRLAKIKAGGAPTPKKDG